MFLLIVCEPVRRGVSKEFIKIRGGLNATHHVGPASWHRREEARRLHELERQDFFDVTRGALLDALYRYPTPPPPRFFSWLRATIAHGALDHLRHELPELETSPRTAVEAQALRNLHGDDVFFSGLCTLGMVRDRARAKAITERYPEGRLPDGRRIVAIDQAA